MNKHENPPKLYHEVRPDHAKLVAGRENTSCIGCGANEFASYFWKRKLRGSTLEFHECIHCAAQYKVESMDRGLF